MPNSLTLDMSISSDKPTYTICDGLRSNLFGAKVGSHIPNNDATGISFKFFVCDVRYVSRSGKLSSHNTFNFESNCCPICTIYFSFIAATVAAEILLSPPIVIILQCGFSSVYFRIYL